MSRLPWMGAPHLYVLAAQREQLKPYLQACMTNMSIYPDEGIFRYAILQATGHKDWADLARTLQPSGVRLWRQQVCTIT